MILDLVLVKLHLIQVPSVVFGQHLCSEKLRFTLWTGPGIHVIEVGAGAAATPRGLHLIHVSAEGTLDLEMTMKIKNIVSEDSLVYSLSFNQTSMNQVA